MELATGGELFDRIVAKESYTEREAADTMYVPKEPSRPPHGTKNPSRPPTPWDPTTTLSLTHTLPPYMMTRGRYTLCDILHHLHTLGIAHRDIKPENLLYSSNAEDAQIKLADFGLSCFISQRQTMSMCGTPGYVAPEMLRNQRYDWSVDMWSAGVILYILLCGFPPFHHDEQNKVFEMILHAR